MSPNAFLCMTGSELTRGETRDLNGSFVASHLSEMGVRVDEISLVPDDPDLLASAIRRAMGLADIVVLSGGLGPTRDDHTVEVLAALLQRRIYRHPQAEHDMKVRARARGVRTEDLPDNYWKQAEVIEGAEVLLNPVGLAPGMIVPTDRGMMAVLPGVPRELQALLSKEILPAIRRRFRLAPPRILRGKIMGIGESWAEARLQKLGIDFERIEYGISAKPGELLVKFIAHDEQGAPYLDTVRDLVRAEFGLDFILLDEGLLDGSGLPVPTEHSRIVHELLLRSGATVATAESCTGGWIAKQLTDHPGSSAYFLGSVVAYGNRAKETLLRVPAAAIEDHGAVSEAVCGAMARAARGVFGADYGLSTTGIAGPTGGSAEKPVGLVYIGIAGKGVGGTAELRVEKANFWGNRENIRTLAAVRALDLLRRSLAAIA